jgi:hypothetical protein
VSLIGGIKQLKAKVKRDVSLIGGAWSRNLTIMEHEGKSKKRDVESRGRGRLVLFLGNANLGLGLEKTSYLYLFFFKCWPGWTGSVWFGSMVSDFENRTELEFFCDFLIW